MDAVGNGLGFEQLAELGNRTAEVFLVVTGNLLEAADHDAGHNQRNADTLAANLTAQPFGKGAHRELAGTVEAAEGRDIPPHHGADNHDVAPLPPGQVLPGPAHQVGGAKDVGPVQLLPLGFVAVEDTACQAPAGVDDDDVIFAPALIPAQSPLQQPVNILRKTCVPGHGKCLAALGRYLRRQFLQPVQAAGSDHHSGA